VSLETRIAALEAKLEQLRAAHREALDAIAETVGDTAFNAEELFAHARVDPALAAVLNARTLRQVGGRLRELAGTDGRWCLLKIGRDENGCIWRIVQSG
jgi:hypothetical protein